MIQFNKEIKRAWIKALRSNAYVCNHHKGAGQKFLKKILEKGVWFGVYEANAYGRLLDIVDKSRWEKEEDGVYKYKLTRGGGVIFWPFLNDVIFIDHNKFEPITEIIDNGLNYEDIAEYIEEYWR